MKRFITALLTFSVVATALMPVSASAVDVTNDTVCTQASTTQVCKGDGDNILGANGLLKKVISLLLAVLGIIAVVMIVIGGIRYTTSAGDSSQTKSARDTIIYAVVGLVIAIMSYAIVNFVIGKL